jgi:hypothetical protein
MRAAILDALVEPLAVSLHALRAEALRAPTAQCKIMLHP